MENLHYYNLSRIVPKEAQRPITAGRIKGKTDINPMWRIKKLTELFGPCGFGWYTEVKKMWIDEAVGNERVVNVEIALYYKQDNEWSVGLVGIGGSKLIAKETSGLFVDDDAYKKAYTDAISVACKSLGIGADVYWGDDTSSKYREEQKESISVASKTGNAEKEKAEKLAKLRAERLAEVSAIMKEKGLDKEDLSAIKDNYGIEKIEETNAGVYKGFIEALKNYGNN